MNNGTINAGDDVLAQAQEDIINGGSITAGGDVTFEAGQDILNSSALLDGLDPVFNTTDGSIEATDVSLSAGGSILMGSITARDESLFAQTEL